MKRALSGLLLMLCALAAGAQTTQITASHIQLFGGSVVTGSFCLSPTDASGNPINIVTTVGQQFAASTSLCFPISNGVLSSSAIVPDVSTTQPVNACYHLTVLSNNKTQLASYQCIQPTGSTWSFDSYVPSSLPNIPAFSSPSFQLNGVPLASQSLLNFICTACTNPSGGSVTVSGNGGGIGGTFVFAPIILRPGRLIVLVPNQPIVLE